MSSFSYPVAAATLLPFAGPTVVRYFTNSRFKAQIKENEDVVEQARNLSESNGNWGELLKARQNQVATYKTGRVYAILSLIGSILTIAISVGLLAAGVLNLPLTGAVLIAYGRLIARERVEKASCEYEIRAKEGLAEHCSRALKQKQA